MQYIRIPDERVSVLIGEGGETKKLLESLTKCKIAVAEGEVSVEGEALEEWLAKDVVHAIGRGFNPEKSLFLLKDGNVFEYVDLSDFANTPKSLARMRGRIIGERGRTRKFIEQNTGAMLSVYGKTVGFIGSFDSVAVAKEAISMLVGGSRHGSVYKFLEKRKTKESLK
jgi:ribosomal RNA assembly protein